MQLWVVGVGGGRMGVGKGWSGPRGCWELGEAGACGGRMGKEGGWGGVHGRGVRGNGGRRAGVAWGT